MIRASLSCMLLILFLGCPRQSDRITPDLLPADSVISEPLMIQLVADVHILEAGIQLKKNRGINTGAVSEYLYEGLFRKYRISGKRFRLNMEYYRSNPAAFEKFYQKVIAEIDSRNPRGVKGSPAKEE